MEETHKRYYEEPRDRIFSRIRGVPMKTNELRAGYFNWLCGIALTDRSADEKPVSVYTKLLSQLFAKPFRYDIPMDGNRAEEGIDLRYRFAEEVGYPQAAVTELDDRDCSVLEMLIALALRCEEHIMHDDREGDRTRTWFWEMIGNLGLLEFTDYSYDEEAVDRILERLLSHGYGPHGEGGLFYIPESPRDLRGVEIWYQLNWYLSSRNRVRYIVQN